MGNDGMLGLIDVFNKMWLGSSSLLDLNSDWYTVPSFPPVDVKLNTETKDMIFDFAVAGYSNEDLDITFSGDYLVLKMTTKAQSIQNKFKIIHSGIRKQDVNFRYYVPSDKYDQNRVEANLANGILTIKIPAREEEQRRKVKIM